MSSMLWIRKVRLEQRLRDLAELTPCLNVSSCYYDKNALRKATGGRKDPSIMVEKSRHGEFAAITFKKINWRQKKSSPSQENQEQ